MSTDIETAFHTSLDRLLRGEATLDACLAEYPEHHARLRDMLVVALDLQALKPLPLDRQAVERGARLIDDELQHLRARLDRQPEPASAWERLTWWFPRFMPVRMAGLAAAFAVALIAYGGVTLAAVNSGPDSALYGYRLTLEELRIGFASDEEKAYLYLDTAEQRLREIESAAETGDAGAVARASTAYQEVVRKGVDVLGAVARDTPPGTERTGEVAADYRRRLAEHGTRFNSLTHAAAEAQRAPITRARSQAQTGLHDVHSGPILAAAPTATPDPSPSPTAVTPAPVPSPSPTPAAVPTPPVSPTPAAPTAAPTATPTAAPTPQVTPEPPAAPTPAPAIDVTGSAVVVTGELLAVTDDELVVAGIPIARGGVAVVDGVPLTARVRAEALVAADGRLTLVGLSVVQPASAGPAPPSEGQPPATPDPSPSPEPTPADGTPPPADQPPPESTPTSTPADGEPTAPPEASPTPDPTPVETTPDAGASPTPDVSPTSTPADGQPTATPDPTPDQTTTPDEGAPTPTPEGSPTPEPTPGDGSPPTETPPPASEVSPTPSPADGAPSPTPETTPSPEATPTESPAPPSDAQQPTPAPSVTPPAEGEPTPTPTEGEPTATPEATPSPQPTPAEATPPAEETPPPDASPTPNPAGTPPTEPTPTPTPDAEPLVAPAPPTLQGVLVAIDAFTVRAGGIVFSRPLDTPLVLHGPMAPGDVVVVTFEALRAASSYVLVAREVAPVHPPDGPAVTRWQGFVSEIGADVLTINGVRVQVPPEARAEDVWAALETGVLVEIELSDAAAAEPAATALRLLGSGAAQSFSSLAGAPFG